MKMKEMNQRIGVAMCVLLLLAIIPVTASAVPGVINYQGYLTDAGGYPLNGDVAITFRVWSAEVAGTELWSESHAAVAVSEGVFNVLLGSSVPIGVEILGGDRWLGMTVGTDAEMTPRMKLTSVAYAIKAGYAETVAVASVDTSALSDTAVTEAKIALGAVTGAKIASGSITSDNVASGAVSSDKIASEAVTGAKIAAGTVTASHLQNGAAITEISDNDGVGSGLDADLLDGQHASAFSLVGHNHDGDYVNATGDSMSAASMGPILSVANSGLGNGVYGSSTAATGVEGYSTGGSGRGVYGTATGNSGRGVDGYALGTSGTGVRGEAVNPLAVTNWGGYFSASGTAGIGVESHATNTGDVTNYGGYFLSNGKYGRGVYGYASGASGRGVYGLASNSGVVTNYGGYFEAWGQDARGIYACANNTGEVTNYGGYFSALGTSGVGVFGLASHTGYVENYGGHFLALGDGGHGVHGVASGLYGSGVYGSATAAGEGTANHGGYFVAAGNTGYGVYATASGTNARGVYGIATNQDDVTNYGGHFVAFGTNGRGVHGDGWGYYGQGVHGRAYGDYGTGVYGSTSGAYGTGVFGSATNTANALNYGGYFLAYGSQGKGVFGQSVGSSGDVAHYGGDFVANGLSGVGVRGSGQSYDFYAGGTGINYGPFTGGHEVKLSEDFPEDTKPGMIVSATGPTQLRRKEDGSPSLSSTLPTVKLSSKAADKSVLGVLVAETPLPEDHWYEAKEGERFATVNALGEGRVWVSNINGDIEVGDYITTSSIPGYGQRQDDDVLHSYTLGKTIEAVDWLSVQESVVIGEREIKVYLIAVTYTSG